METKELIKEGIKDWLVDLIANRKIKQAEETFAKDPVLQKRFKELGDAEEKLRDTWDDLCKKRKGTDLDCDKIMKGVLRL